MSIGFCSSIGVFAFLLSHFVDATCNVDWTFNSGTVGQPPACWTCGPGARVQQWNDWGGAYVATTANLKSNDNVAGTFLYMGYDEATGTCISHLFQLPTGISSITYKQTGGASTPSGLWLIRSDGTVLCTPPSTMPNTNAWQTIQNCQGLHGRGLDAPTVQVYFFAQDSRNGGWGKVFIDDIQFLNQAGNVLTVSSTSSSAPTRVASSCLANNCSSHIESSSSCALNQNSLNVKNYINSQSKAWTLDVVTCCSTTNTKPSALAQCASSNCVDMSTVGDKLAKDFYALVPSLCTCYANCTSVQLLMQYPADMYTSTASLATLMADTAKIAQLCSSTGYPCFQATSACQTALSSQPMSAAYPQISTFLATQCAAYTTTSMTLNTSVAMTTFTATNSGATQTSSTVRVQNCALFLFAIICMRTAQLVLKQA